MSLEVQDARSQEPLEGGRALRPLAFALPAGIRRSAVYALMGVVLIPLVGWRLRDLVLQ